MNRVSSLGPNMCENQRLRVKYYNSCRNFAKLREDEAYQSLREELESQGAYEANIVEDAFQDYNDDGFLVGKNLFVRVNFVVLSKISRLDNVEALKQFVLLKNKINRMPNFLYRSILITCFLMNFSCFKYR